MTTLSIVSVVSLYLSCLFFLKTIYFDFFKFNDNLVIFTHSSILANSALIFVSVSLIILFLFGESILL